MARDLGLKILENMRGKERSFETGNASGHVQNGIITRQRGPRRKKERSRPCGMRCPANSGRVGIKRQMKMQTQGHNEAGPSLPGLVAKRPGWRCQSDDLTRSQQQRRPTDGRRRARRPEAPFRTVWMAWLGPRQPTGEKGKERTTKGTNAQKVGHWRRLGALGGPGVRQLDRPGSRDKTRPAPTASRPSSMVQCRRRAPGVPPACPSPSISSLTFVLLGRLSTALAVLPGQAYIVLWTAARQRGRETKAAANTSDVGARAQSQSPPESLKSPCPTASSLSRPSPGAAGQRALVT